MAKARKRNTVSGKAPKDKPRTKAEVAAAKRILAANKPKAKRSKGKKPKKKNEQRKNEKRRKRKEEGRSKKQEANDESTERGRRKKKEEEEGTYRYLQHRRPSQRVLVLH